jgi:hypothetical protein
VLKGIWYFDMVIAYILDLLINIIIKKMNLSRKINNKIVLIVFLFSVCFFLSLITNFSNVKAISISDFGFSEVITDNLPSSARGYACDHCYRHTCPSGYSMTSCRGLGSRYYGTHGCCSVCAVIDFTCTCIPSSCVTLGYNCGTHSDGCGGITGNCGSCAGTDASCECVGGLCSTCVSPDVCVGGSCCTPKTCVDLGYNCGGAYSDDCGGIIESCGSCAGTDASCECIEGSCSTCVSPNVCVMNHCKKPQGLWIMDKLVVDIIADAIDWAINLLAIIAILMAIIGGIAYIFSSGDPQRAAFARKIILWALGGLMIAGLAYAMIVLLENIVTL